MKRTFKLFGIVAMVAVIGFSTTGCPTDTADIGTFRVRITDIPLSYFNAADGPGGRFEIGLFSVGQAPSMAHLIAGRDTRLSGNDNSGIVVGSGWFEFYFYPIPYGDPFVGFAGNYDIGLHMFGPGNTLRYAGILVNVRLEVNRVNAISFTTFGPPQPPDGTLAEQLAWLRTNALSGVNHTVTISRDESLTPAQAVLPSGRSNLAITIRGDGTMRTISLAENGSLFDVGSSVILVLGNNVTLRGRAGNDNPLIQVRHTGILTLNDGAVITGNTETGNNNTWGGGVMLWDGGIFFMHGGEISNNSANWGGGVQAQGTFTMYGGTISGNTARGGGGGVNATNDQSVFTMNNGTISGNTVTSHSYAIAGGVRIGGGGTFAMHNGTISANTVTTTGTSLATAGGVHVSNDGTFVMHNGRIFDNTVSSSLVGAWGGGVSVGGTFTMHGGEISDNTASGATWGQGGGVLVNSHEGGLFNMRGGTISGNVTVSNGVAWANGGGVFVCGYNAAAGGTFLMSGGVVLYNNIVRHTGNTVGSNVALFVGTSGANSATARFGTFVGNTFSRMGDLITTNNTIGVVNGVWQGLPGTRGQAIDLTPAAGNYLGVVAATGVPSTDLVTDGNEFVELHVDSGNLIHGLDLLFGPHSGFPNVTALSAAGLVTLGNTYTVIVEGRAAGLPMGDVRVAAWPAGYPDEGYPEDRVTLTAGALGFELELEFTPLAGNNYGRVRIHISDATTTLILTRVEVTDAAGNVVWSLAEVLMCQDGML